MFIGTLKNGAEIWDCPGNNGMHGHPIFITHSSLTFI